MGQRKKRFVALVCAVSVIAFSGCGDDLTQQVCIPGVEELAQPIGGYHTCLLYTSPSPRDTR